MISWSTPNHLKLIWTTFEKCHFMVTEGIVLGHLVSARGIEVDKAKIDAISSLPNPTSVWEKDTDFVFDQPCVDAFRELKRRLTFMPILQTPNWELSFELMCGTSNSMLGAPHVIAYASRTMDATQVNYTTTGKELLAIMFALGKFKSYLLGSKIVVFFYHAMLKYLLKKSNAKLRLIRWMSFLQEFDVEIRDKKSAKNVVANHLSRLEREVKPIPI
ncbi:Retrovirus-related Pol polyprotein from transposon 17.6, partial [Mucuna pruriens]